MAPPPRQRIDPLDWQTPIVDPETGKPTQQFRQLWERLFGNESGTNASKADKSTLINTTAPLDGGGDLSGNRTLFLQPSGVTPDTYGDATNVPQITVDEFGRILTAADVPITGGGGAWTIAATTTIGAPVAQVDFTGLGIYSDLMVVLTNVTSSATGFRSLRVSTNNGATFFSTSGDYRSFNNTGVATNATSSAITDGTATTAISGVSFIHAANTNGPRIITRPQRTIGDNMAEFVGSTLPINAIRIFNGAGNLTGGTITVFGR